MFIVPCCFDINFAFYAQLELRMSVWYVVLDANALQTLPPLIFTTTPFLHSPHLSGKETGDTGRPSNLPGHIVGSAQVGSFQAINNLNL